MRLCVQAGRPSEFQQKGDDFAYFQDLAGCLYVCKYSDDQEMNRSVIEPLQINNSTTEGRHVHPQSRPNLRDVCSRRADFRFESLHRVSGFSSHNS